MQQFTSGVNLDLPRLISLLDRLAQAIPESGEARTMIPVIISFSKLAFDGLSNAQIEQQLRGNFPIPPKFQLNKFLEQNLGPDIAVLERPGVVQPPVVQPPSVIPARVVTQPQPVLQPPATPSTPVPSIGLEPDVLTPPVQPPATAAAGAALPLLIAAAAAVLLN
jgi:hypothetical protein